MVEICKHNHRPQVIFPVCAASPNHNHKPKNPRLWLGKRKKNRASALLMTEACVKHSSSSWTLSQSFTTWILTLPKTLHTLPPPDFRSSNPNHKPKIQDAARAESLLACSGSNKGSLVGYSAPCHVRRWPQCTQHAIHLRQLAGKSPFSWFCSLARLRWPHTFESKRLHTGLCCCHHLYVTLGLR